MQSGENNEKSTEYLILSVTVERYSTGVLIFHEGDDVDSEDVAVLKVETPGILYKTEIKVSVPSAGTKNYDQFIAAIPARKEMWERLKVPERHLLVEVRSDMVDKYLKTKNDRSLVLPSVDVFAFKRIENGMVEPAKAR